MRRSPFPGACPSTLVTFSLVAMLLAALTGCRDSGDRKSGGNPPGSAGAPTGVVSGYVFRVSGRAVPHGRATTGEGHLVIRADATPPEGSAAAGGATVTLADPSRVARSTSADPQGFFSMGVEARAYVLTAALDGYAPVSVPVDVQPNQTVRVDSGAVPDTTPPILVSAAAAPDGLHVALTFDEPLDPVSANLASAYSVTPALAVSAAALQADGRSVLLTTGAQTGGVSYTVKVVGVKDVAGNAVAASGVQASFAGSEAVPWIVSANAVDGTHVDVLFTEPLDPASVSVGAFAIEPTLVVSAAVLLPPPVGGGQGGVTVRLTTPEQVRFYPYAVTVQGVRDTGGNVIDPGHATAAFVGNGTPPQVVSVAALDTTHVEVRFSEAVAPAEAAAAASYSCEPALAIAAAEVGTDGLTIRLTTAEQLQGVSYRLAVQSVKDLAGNLVDAGRNGGDFIGIGTPPELLSVQPVDATHVDALFSEPLSAASANLPRNYRTEPPLDISGAELRADGMTVRLTLQEHTNGTWYALTVFDVQDLVGNKVDSAKSTYGYTGIGVAPTVVGATALTGTIVDLIYSETVDATSAGLIANYTITPALEVRSAALQLDGKTVRLGTDTQTQGVSYTVAAAGVKDAAGNRLDSTRASATFTGAPILARVTSALGIDSNHVDVRFSKPVDAVTASVVGAYIIEPSLAASAAELQPDGTTVRLTTVEQVRYRPYTVTVQGVKDTAGNGLDPTQTRATFIGNGAPPQVVAIAAVDSTHVDIHFDEALSPVEASKPASYTLLPKLAVHAAELLPDKMSVRLTTGEQTDGTAYSVTLSEVKDVIGNSTGVLNGAAIWRGIGIPPQAVSATAIDSTQVDLLFNETISRTEAEKPANYSVSPPLAVTGARLQEDGRTVRLVTAAQAKAQVYIVTARLIQDAAGNRIDAARNGASFTGAEGQTPPRVVAAMALDQTFVHVTFSERVDPVTAVDVANYAITPELRVRGARILSDGNTVRLTTNSQAEGTAYSLTVSKVKDLAGNPLAPAAVVSFTGTGAAAPPRLVAVAPVDNTHVDLTFSEALLASSVSGGGNYPITPALTVAHGILQPDGKSVRLVTGQQSAGVQYTLSVRSVLDLAGTPVGTEGSTGSFTGIGIAEARTLTGASVTPESGPNSAGFTYRVTYTHPKNVAPVYVRLSIFGPGGTRLGIFAMAKEDPADVTYTDGCVYQWQASMLPGPVGTLSFQVDATDGAQPAEPATGTGPVVDGIFPGRIAFSSDRAGGYEIFVMKADGTDAVQVSRTGAHAHAPDWYPDGSRIIFAALDGLYSVSVDGTAQTKLEGTSKLDSAPDWSPAAGRVCFVSVRDGNAEIYQANPDGTGQIRLTTSGADESFPSWSPDGSKIAFVSKRDGNEEIYVMSSDGSSVTRLTRNAANDWEPEWSPDGKRIAFTSNRDGNEEIYVMNADGTSPRRLTENHMIDWHPTWMADGKHILFTSYRDGDGEIFVMRDDGGGQIALTNNNAQDMAPAFSAGAEAAVPYSASISADPTILPASATAKSTIKVVVRDGGYKPCSNAEVTFSTTLGTIEPASASTDANGQVTATLTATASPGTAVVTASVTGGLNPTATVKVPMEFFGRIGFISDRHGPGTGEFYTIGADGTGEKRVTFTTELQQHPSWSPDGSRFAVGLGTAGSEEIYALEADGSHPVRLTDAAGSDVDPAWSPDGTRIAFASNRDGNFEIYTMNADGTGQRRVTTDLAGQTASDRNPTWSPDGVSLAFESETGGVSHVAVVRADGTARRVLAPDGSAPAWAPDGSRIAFASRRDGNANIYTINSDGTDERRLTDDPGDDVQPTWAVQSAYIVFCSNRAGNGDIYVMNTDGSGQTRVTASTANETSPACTWAGGPQLPTPYSVTVNASSTVLRANGTDACTITAVVRDGGYRRLPGTKVVFDSPLGAFVPESVGTDDEGRAATKFLAGNVPGVAIISAAAEGGRNPQGTVALTLDAGHILFESNRDGNWEIYVMRGDGSDQVRLTNHPAEDRSPVASADSTRIAFVSNRSDDGNPHIWIMERDGSAPVQITSGDCRDSQPAWSSDATTIYFTREANGQTDIYAMYADGTGLQPVTRDNAVESGPVTRGPWVGYTSDRDGDEELYLRDRDVAIFLRHGYSGARDYDMTLSGDYEVAFTSNRDGNDEIYRLDPRIGTLYQQIRLTRDAAWDGDAAWWPAGPRIAFASARDGNREIYMMDSDGTKQTRLTSDPGDDQAPAWLMEAQSPRPYSVVLTSNTASMPATATSTCVLTATVRDGGFRRLAKVAVQFTAKNGTVSPASGITDDNGECKVTYKAGTIEGIQTTVVDLAASAAGVKGELKIDLHAGRIAYYTDRDGNSEIYTINPDGEDLVRLTDNQAEDQWPHWSPTGSHIVFQSNRDGNWDIYTMKADGTDPRRLTTSLAADTLPAWSPDGRHIAFVSDGDSDGDPEIWVMKADGAGAVQITNNTTADTFPAWSPDSQRIAFASNRTGDYEIYTMRPDGTEVVQLTYSAAEDSRPAWSPDGTKILFHSLRDSPPPPSPPVEEWKPTAQIYMMNPDGTGQTRISMTTLSQLYPSWSPDGRRCVMVTASFGSEYVMVRDLRTVLETFTTLGLATESGPSWSWGPYVSQVAPAPAEGRRRKEADISLRAVSGGEQAQASLTAQGVEPAAGSGRAGGLRFVPLSSSAVPGRARTRTWNFAVAAGRAGAEVTLSWPDLSGLGSRDRVTLEDLDARSRRAMRTTAAYTFRVGEDGTRRFRVTAAPRTGPAVAITGISVAQTRSGARSVRYTLSTAAAVDVDVIAPSGQVVATITRAHVSQSGANQVGWSGKVAPGIYLLRITARTEEGVAVQATRPVALVR